MQREMKKPRGVGLYVLVACIFFLLLGLFVAISISQDVRREKDRFAQNAYYIYSYLDSVADQNLIALDGFAALLQAERANNVHDVAAYARFMLDNHASIYSLGLIQKVSRDELENFVAAQHHNGAPEFQPKAYIQEGVARWRPIDDKPFYHLITHIESRTPQSGPLLGMDLDSLPVMQDTLRRALATDGAVASVPFRLFEGEMGYVLVRSIRRTNGVALVMLRCQASSLLPAQIFEAPDLAIGVYAQKPDSGDRLWLIQRRARPSAPLADLLFPKFSVVRPFGGRLQPFMLELEQQVDWSVVNWNMLATIVGGGALVFPLLLAYASIHHNREMQRLEQGNKLFFMANFDSLTGLPNRQLFVNRLEQSMAMARRQGLMHAVLFLDLDGFKSVNDYYGHQIGDKVLQRAARIFQRSVREIDTVARIGGDEFVILLHGVDGRSSAEHVARKIKRAFHQPSVESNRAIPMIGTSIGIAIFPDDGETVDELLNAADLKMYQDKVSRKSPSDSGSGRRGPNRFDEDAHLL